MRRFREPPRTGSEPVADRFRQPVPGGGLYRPPEPVPRSRQAITYGSRYYVEIHFNLGLDF